MHGYFFVNYLRLNRSYLLEIRHHYRNIKNATKCMMLKLICWLEPQGTAMKLSEITPKSAKINSEITD